MNVLLRQSMIAAVILCRESEVRTELEVEVEVAVMNGQPFSTCDITASRALTSSDLIKLLSILFIDLFLLFVYCINERKGSDCFLKTLQFWGIFSSF